MNLTVVILAAGQGKRMRSDLPKVLHPLAGRPLLAHVTATARALKPRQVRVVHGHGGEQVQAAFAGAKLAWYHQAEQRGTGHAVKQALPGIPGSDIVLVLYGDVPLVQAATLRKLLARARRGELAVLTADLADPTGYGRVIRDARGRVTAIVEHKDADQAQRALREINTGLLACRASLLAGWIRRLRANNAQQEYYLTDIVGLAARDGVPIAGLKAGSEGEVLGINDKTQLAAAERVIRQRAARALLEAGVTLVDPDRIDVRGTLTCGRDVHIDANVTFEGTVRLADGVRIGPCTLVRDAEIGAGTIVHSHCVIEEGRVGPGSLIGPYARLRPGSRLAAGVHLGNFVEIKQSTIGPGSKVNHLSYVGDATLGASVNIGAGTIVANYDGANKHPTVIGDNAHTGSNSVLVAPITVGPGATIGAGSTVTRRVPAGGLTVARAKQVTLPGWKRPAKKRG